jgi:peptidoglycan/xylan/chitin deacetylase (PgdA/CDA1 family)
VLDILAGHGAAATFFVQGNHVERHPETLRRIVDAGHEVGNHSYDHSRPDPFGQAILCDAVLGRHGVRTRLFRPPGGAFSARDLARLAWAGYSTVLWSLDAADSMREEGKWRGPDPDYSSVRRGDIVLMHDDNARCLADLPILLTAVREKGLRAVVVSELLGTGHRAASVGG